MYVLYMFKMNCVFLKLFMCVYLYLKENDLFLYVQIYSLVDCIGYS